MNLSFKERLAATLLCLMKYNDEEFIVCKRNDFIFMLINMLGVDLESFLNKVVSNYLKEES